MKSKVFQRITATLVFFALVFASPFIFPCEVWGEGEAVKEAKILATKNSYSPKILDSQADIYVMGVGPRNIRNITNTDDASEYNPSWSPDGEWIAFSKRRTRNEPTEIFTMKADGTNVRPLGVKGYKPVWSPDGEWIAFSSATNNDMFVISKDGTGLRILAGSGDGPSWSPDGKFIAYTSGRGDGISIVDVESDSVRRLTDRGERPSWSPDGTKIAFMMRGWGEHIYLFDFTSRGNEWLENVVPLTNDLGNDRTSVFPLGWTSDGKLVIRGGTLNGLPGPFVMDILTKDLVRILPDAVGGEFGDFAFFGKISNEAKIETSLSVSPNGKLSTLWGVMKKP